MIDGLVNKITGRSKYKKVENPEPPFKDAKNEEDKIKSIVQEKSESMREDDMQRSQVHLKMELMFRGYHNLGEFNRDLCAYEVYDEEPLEFTENRFRRDALILQGSLIRMEPPTVIRPASGSSQDMAAAEAAGKALDIIRDNIDHDQILAEKSLNKVLFGTSFQYSEYQIDKRYGTVLVPKFEYKDVQIPGSAYCAQCGESAPMGTPQCPTCGYPMEEQPPMTTEAEISDGFEERTQGQEFTAVYSPLEVLIPSRTKGGLRNSPLLVLRTREDIDSVLHIYKDLDVNGSKGGSTGSFDTALRFQDRLGGLTGLGGRFGRLNQTKTWEVLRVWLRPQTYKGDPQLLKAAPDGLMAVLVEGEVVEWRPENLDDHWTMEVGISNPHSAYGDGLMFDNVPVQKMINVVNKLQVRHLEYDTIPLRLYDDDLVVAGEVTNDPAQKWIKCNTNAEKGLDQAVRELPPGQLSMDLYQFKQGIYQADQDLSGATDPVAGKIAGANTPYSAQVLAVEQGQTRLLGAMKFNAGAVREHTRQLLKLAQENWIDPRQKAEIDETIGKTTWASFTGADLAQGSFVVKILTNDFKPKTRADALAGMEAARNIGIDVLGSPKMRLDVFEKLGLDTSGDTLSTQAKKAYRVMDKIRLTGQPVAPDPLIDDGIIQSQVIQEFLASDQGDQLQEENLPAFEAIKVYMQTVIQMTAIRQMAMGAMGLPGLLGPAPAGDPAESPSGGSPAAKKGTPGGQPGQNPGGPKTENAQAPVPEGQQKPMPAMAQGARS